jgi:hypothetical protein
MRFMYGCANGNFRGACRLYTERYPQRRIPSNKLSTKVHQRMRESGSFAPCVSERGRPRSIPTSDMEVRVLRRVGGDPGTNVRETAAAKGIGIPAVWRILHEQSLCPYHIQRVQALTPAEHHATAVLCQLKYFVTHTDCS